MTGKEAVAKAKQRLKDGLPVKLWAKDSTEEIKFYPEGFYSVYYQGSELCKGMNRCHEVMEEKFLSEPEVFIL